MNARRFLLVGLNVGLVAVLAMALASSPDESTPVAVENPLQRMNLVASEPDQRLATEATTSKPLFARALIQAPAEAAPKPLPAAPAFRLAGILWGDPEKIAVIQLPNDLSHRRVRLGEKIDEWTLRELAPKVATFDSGDRRAVLSLNREIIQN